MPRTIKKEIKFLHKIDIMGNLGSETGTIIITFKSKAVC